MDETEPPEDSLRLPDIQEELRSQLLGAIERSKQPGQDMEWTPEEQAELNAELARVVFDPAHANPDFPDRMVTIADEGAPVHAYNNFPLILSVMDKVRHSQEQLREQTFEAAYAAAAKQRRYHEIFDALQAAYPALYKRTIQIFRESDPDMRLSQDERAYIQSQTYSAAAHIALEITPTYDLGFLRR